MTQILKGNRLGQRRVSCILSICEGNGRNGYKGEGKGVI